MLHAGTTQTLSVSFTPTDAANYTSATATVSINVLKATPVITWTTPGDITYGAALGAAQLNATANVPGTFVYTPDAGTILPAGAHVLSVSFTPNDAANYRTVTKTVSINVRGDARVTVDKTTVGAAATITAFVADGPGNAGDWVALYPVGSSSYVDWKYLNGTRTMPATGLKDASVSFSMPLTLGNYVVKLNANNTSTVLATSAPITVLSASITVGTTTVTAGGTVIATIANGPGNATDWVGLYAADGVTRVAWKYLNGTETVPGAGTPNAVVSFTLPLASGAYTLRLYAANLITPLATSPTITVPAAPPSPSLTINPAAPGPGATITATVANAPGNPTDWVAMYAEDGTRLAWQYLNGTSTPPATGLTSAALSFTLPLTGGTFTLKLHPSNNYTVLASATVTVGGMTFTATPATIAPGGTVTARLANGPGNVGDWIGLFAPDGSRLAWKYLNGSQSVPAVGLTAADVPFALPMTAGTYTIRLFANFTQTVLATAAPITVSAPAQTTVTATPTTIVPGSTVQVSVANGLGNAADWVALWATGGSTYLDWKYLNGTRNVPASGVTNGTVSFTMPTAPGTYVFRFYANNSYTLLAESAVVTVLPITLTASTTTAAPGATVTATVANGPGNRTDWIGIFVTGESTYLDWRYLNGSKTLPETGATGAVVPFTLPTNPGSYTLKFFAGSTLLATSEAIIVQ